MSHGSSAFDSLFVPTGETNGEGDLHLADGEEGDKAFAFGESSGGGTAVATAPSTKTTVLRPKKPPKSAVKEIIKIVLGGVVGLSIGYMILLWGFDRDLMAGAPISKPVGKLLPEWMQWAIPAGHRSDAAKKTAPVADDSGADKGTAEDGTAEEGTEGEVDPNAEGAATDTGAEGTDNLADMPGDATSTDTPGEAPMDDNPTDSGTSTDTTTPPGDSTPGDTTPGDTTPGDSTPKTPNVDDPGLEIKPKPEFEIEEPKIDPLAPDMPPMDDPKVDEPKVDEPKTTDPQVTDPAVTDPPMEDPFDIKPGDTPMEDPKPTEPKPAEPKVGLKVETPVDEKTVESAREAASGLLETLMPSDAAAKAGFTREKYEVFGKLCEYANSLSNSAPGVSAMNAEAAKAMVLMVVADDADNRVLGQLANTWLSRTRGNDGIALAGKVTAVATEGGLTTITVELPALGDKLAARSTTIVTRETAEVATGDEVAAVGSVIEKPADKIEGYKGADSQVIWGAWVGKRTQ
jgi:hypothetical protein